MAYEPFYSSSPSDSGLLEGIDTPLAAGPPRHDARVTNVPPRDEYDTPAAGKASAADPEESLREAPLPEGFLARLRGFVGDL